MTTSLRPGAGVTAHLMAQRSPEWVAVRLGRVTASVASDVLATRTSRKGEAASRRNLRVRLVLERLTGRSQECSYLSPDMQRGIDLEPEALGAYEARTGRIVQRCGFLAHDTLLAGASLDGYLGNYDGLVEVKCPKAGTHLDTLRSRTPGEYSSQIEAQLWLSGAGWCDYVSYHPDFPVPLDLVIIRVTRDEAALAVWERALRQFLQETEAEEAEVRTMLAETTP